MGAFKSIHIDTFAEAELVRLRAENDRLREQIETLERMAEQYLMALLTRAINEVSND